MKTKIKYLLLILILWAPISSCNEWAEYTVEITYCDHRGTDTIVVCGQKAPDNTEIATWKVAVPTWRRTYFNVCNLKTLSGKKLKKHCRYYE
jgi:hypothetical protein